MTGELTIPILPCRSIDETLAFYVALGFEVTYRQERPNTYGCVKLGDIDLHFFTMKGYEPKNSYSTCIVLVPDLAALHQTFSNRLRQHYGKLPVAGIPRISKLNNANSAKQLRFNIIDPGGNWVRFAQKEGEPALNTTTQTGAQSKLARATHAADLLVEAEGNFQAAAQMLDKALANEQSASPAQRFQALVLRVALAVSMDDLSLAQTLAAEARQITLTDAEREPLSAELQRLDDLEAVLRER